MHCFPATDAHACPLSFAHASVAQQATASTEPEDNGSLHMNRIGSLVPCWMCTHVCKLCPVVLRAAWVPPTSVSRMDPYRCSHLSTRFVPQQPLSHTVPVEVELSRLSSLSLDLGSAFHCRLHSLLL